MTGSERRPRDPPTEGVHRTFLVEGGEDEHGNVYEIQQTGRSIEVRWWDRFGEHLESRPAANVEEARRMVKHV